MGFKEYTDAINLKDEVKKSKEEIGKLKEEIKKIKYQESLYLNCSIILLDKLTNSELEYLGQSVSRRLINGLNDYV